MRYDGLAAPLVARRVHLAAALAFGLASVPAEHAVAVVSGLALIFFERDLVVAPVVSAAVFGLASVLAEHAFAVVSDLGQIVFARAPAAVVLVAVFVLVAFLADRAFALPAVLAVHRPLC